MTRNNSIQEEFISYASNEGEQTALDELQDIQQALETILEVGCADEQAAAILLLNRVNQSIKTIVELAKS